MIRSHTINHIKHKTLILKLFNRPFFLFLIGIVLIISYQNNLSGVYVFDDFPNIIENPNISINSLTIHDLINFFSIKQPCANRQIVYLSFALNHYFSQFNPVSYHFINILIHIINTWLVFWLFNWYFAKLPNINNKNIIIISALSALWWATNPIQTNAVSYVVQRMTSMSTMFCLISLMFYIKSRSPHIKKSSFPKVILLSLVSIISWIIAMFCKEIAAILPILIIVHEFYFFNLYKHIKTKQKAVILTSIFVFMIILFETFVFIGPTFLHYISETYKYRDFTLIERLLTEPRVVFHYISLFLFPLANKLRLYYDLYPVSHNFLSPPSTIFAFAGIAIWLLSIIYFFKNNRLISLGLLWTFICLIIESTIIPLELVYDHRFYMPSIGFTIALISTIHILLQRTTIRYQFIFLTLSILISSQIIGTIARNKTWSNELTFAAHELKKNSESRRALINFGVYILKKGDPVLAYNSFKKAIKLYPNDVVARVNLYGLHKDPPFKDSNAANTYLYEIIKILKKQESHPSDDNALGKLAHLLFKEKRYKESLILLEKISDVNASAEVFLHIGQCYMQLGFFREALNAFNRALEFEPENAEIKSYISMSLKNIKEIDS